MKEDLIYNEAEDSLTVAVSYDAEPVLEQNKAIKNSLNSKAIKKYEGNLVHAASFDEGDVIRLKNIGYNILSPDPSEVRRALVYIQENESHLLLVHGKPFTTQRIKWI
ncbi:hypothetical protein KAR91_22665 [Candidatus Pacearchaeota archaeon]|nr:hypothetical protein [Candidatus Pacearchaeota archaeon]